MSAEVWVSYPPCEHCGNPGAEGAEVNITYNLSPMLHAAGFVGWRELAAMSARDAGRHVLAVLDGMRNDPKRWLAMNPPNGWGYYDECLQGRLRRWAETASKESPAARVGASL